MARFPREWNLVSSPSTGDNALSSSTTVTESPIMSSRHLSFLPLVLLLIHSVAGECAAPPGAQWPLDAKRRQELDQEALSQPRLTIADQRANVAASIPAFLLTALDLPAAEELRRSREVHAEMIKGERIRPTPPVAERLLTRLV